jgi:hypothetical protein
MAYSKSTHVTGTRNGEFASFWMRGHVRPENSLSRAQRLGVTVNQVEHCVFDTSGKGRGGHDGKWRYENGAFIKAEDWREGGKVVKGQP